MPGYTRTGTYDDTKKFRRELPLNKSLYIHDYLIRSQLLDERYTPLTTLKFYRQLFPKGWLEKKGEQKKTGVTAIMTVIPQTTVKYTQEEQELLEKEGRTKSKAFNRLITDDLQELNKYKGLNYFSLISPVSYYGRKHTGKNARWLHALTFDIDDVKEENMRYFFRFVEEINALPRPTMIVNSGGGLHLYYVFDNPIPMLPQYKAALNDFKEALTRQLWTKWTSSNRNVQIHGITQGYRVIGTRTKLGYEKQKNEETGEVKRIEYRVKAWLSGTPVSLDYLNNYVPERQRIDLTKIRTSKISLDKAKKRYPEWYEKVIVKGEKAWGTWTCSKNVYRWWVRKILEEGKVGNRYNCLRLLSAFALKCGIDAKELWQDNQRIYKMFASMTPPGDPNFLTMDEAAKAYHQFFHPEFIRVSIKSINKLTGFNIEKNRRNGNTRAEHLAICRFKRDLKRKDGDDWRNKDGAPVKKDIVVRWRLQNENGLKGTKSQCQTDTGLSLPTIRKWWPVAEEEGAKVPVAKLKDDRPQNIDNLGIEEKWAMIDSMMESMDLEEKAKSVADKATTWDDILLPTRKEPISKAEAFLQIASKQAPILFAKHRKNFESWYNIPYTFENDVMIDILNNATSWKKIEATVDKMPPMKAVSFLKLASHHRKDLLRDYYWKSPDYNVNDHIRALYIMATMPDKTPDKAGMQT